MELIEKAAVVAEIERIKSYIGSDKYLSDFEKGCNFGREDVCDSLLNFLDTLEVKEVEDTELLKVRGYLVRDKDDYTAIYTEKPHRGKTEWVDGNNSCLVTINNAGLVSDIEFEDEPVEVEVVIKVQKRE